MINVSKAILLRQLYTHPMTIRPSERDDADLGQDVPDQVIGAFYQSVKGST